MNRYMLVHGAFTGGWCWKHVRSLLLAAGHDVYAPTLTGLGERAHLARPDLTIQTHVDDLCAVITAEELSDIILVGHSSSGVLAAAVVDSMPSTVAHLVFLDSSIPSELGFELSVPPPAKANLIDGYLCAPPPLAMQGVPADDPAAAWYDRRRVPMPLGVAEGSFALTGSWRRTPSTYIACTGGPPNPHAMAAREKAVAFGIPVKELAATHAAMATAPALLAAMLMEQM